MSARTEHCLPNTTAGLPRERLTLSITEAAAALGISRSLAYELARQEKLPVIRLGRRLVVPRAALERLLEAANGN
jgi:excisionase family DNA binding protein